MLAAVGLVDEAADVAVVAAEHPNKTDKPISAKGAEAMRSNAEAWVIVVLRSE